jgi:hypothetical protein
MFEGDLIALKDRKRLPAIDAQSYQEISLFGQIHESLGAAIANRRLTPHGPGRDRSRDDRRPQSSREAFLSQRNVTGFKEWSVTPDQHAGAGARIDVLTGIQGHLKSDGKPRIATVAGPQVQTHGEVKQSCHSPSADGVNDIEDRPQRHHTHRHLMRPRYQIRPPLYLENGIIKWRNNLSFATHESAQDLRNVKI